MLKGLIARLRGFMVRWRWARFYRRGGERTWLHEPPVRRYVNQSVTGSEDRWPMDWFAERCATAFRRGLSLGCGEGALERDVVGRGICAEILGIDLLEALERARDLAREAGLQGITYRRADMNRLELDPGAFDVVFFHQSLHHVENLEGCLEAVRRALVPGGTIYLDEYVGPSRDGWDRPMLADAEAALADYVSGLEPGADVGDLWATPLGVAARAADAESIELCLAAQSELDTSKRSELAGVPWIPPELKEVVVVAFGCIADER